MVPRTGRGRIFRGEVDYSRCFGQSSNRATLPSEVVDTLQCPVRLPLYHVVALLCLGGAAQFSWSRPIMKNPSNRWKFLLVVLVVAWSFYEMYPPAVRNLVKEFQAKAARKDKTFSEILERARNLQQERPERAFANLLEAVGTNDITRYFPSFQVKDERDPSRAVLNRLQKDAAGKIKLGLDLQGGTSFLVGIDTNYLAGDTNSIVPRETRQPQALMQAAEVLRNRVDQFGVAEPVIQPAGSDRLLIQLPGLSDADKDNARAQIQKAAYLEFRMVHEDSDQLVKNGEVPPGCELLKHKERLRNGAEQIEQVIVKKQPELTGSAITSAMAVRGNMGESEIEFTLSSEGARRFAEITRNNVGRRLAIVLDHELYSAPRINGEIPSGRGQITGNFSDVEAHQLANVLQNPLQVPVGIKSESSVDPTLGKDTIHSGILSAVYGTIAVAGFMMAYYLFAGFVADIALMTNIVILLGVMCSIGTTLTLPGIAGVVLTIGMAVDANVLIFERIREESAKGKSLRGALAAGYQRAFRTILDSHVTPLISFIILIYMGTGPIKGFGVTLTIGVAASLFTALVVTRLIFDFVLDRGWLKALPMFHIIRATKLDFMKLAKPAFAMSWLLIAIGVGYGLYRGKSAFGVDFLGGDTTIFSFENKADEAVVRSALTKAEIKDPLIQYQRDLSSRRETLRVDSATGTGSNVVSVITGL